MGANARLSRLLREGINCTIVLFFLMGMTLTNSSPAIDDEKQIVCKHTNHTCEKDPSLCEGTEKCSTFCHSSWKNDSETGIQFHTQGCWIGTPDMCQNRNECVEERGRDADDNFYYCCCEGNMCNEKVFYRPNFVSTVAPVIPPVTPAPAPYSPPIVRTVLYSLIPMVGLSVIIVLMFWFYRRHKTAYHESLPSADQTPISEVAPSTPLLNHFMVQLIEVKARGRFGCVWKAQLVNDVVAVKIFPVQDKQSYYTERDFYTMPQVGLHENILHFIGADRRGEGVTTELWLLTEYHEHGSLYDYLKANVVSWRELLKISEGIVRGLAFLHEELPPSKLEGAKPAVVHRDLKSKNILLKKDLTTCIGDFGLALQFEPHASIGDTHGQVGTRRYMAPEVLEGAINFNRDAFLRIDMYACGLVLWEIASRCSAQDGPVDEYRLPFEEEVGSYPTLEDMQESVVQKKCRPQFKDNWRKHKGLRSICDTIEETWDHDPEARLSAGCVEERLSQLKRPEDHSCCVQNAVNTNSSHTNPASLTVHSGSLNMTPNRRYPFVGDSHCPGELEDIVIMPTSRGDDIATTSSSADDVTSLLRSSGDETTHSSSGFESSGGVDDEPGRLTSLPMRLGSEGPCSRSALVPCVRVITMSSSGDETPPKESSIS